MKHVACAESRSSRYRLPARNYRWGYKATYPAKGEGAAVTSLYYKKLLHKFYTRFFHRSGTYIQSTTGFKIEVRIHTSLVFIKGLSRSSALPVGSDLLTSM